MQNKLSGGLILTCIGGPEKKLTFKKSKDEKTNINDFFINQKKIIDVILLIFLLYQVLMRDNIVQQVLIYQLEQFIKMVIENIRNIIIL